MTRNTNKIKSAAADLAKAGIEEISVEGFYVEVESLKESVLDSYDVYEIGYKLDLPTASLEEIIKAFEEWLLNFKRNNI